MISGTTLVRLGVPVREPEPLWLGQTHSFHLGTPIKVKRYLIYLDYLRGTLYTLIFDVHSGDDSKAEIGNSRKKDAE
jgi:hypothetical protein